MSPILAPPHIRKALKSFMVLTVSRDQQQKPSAKKTHVLDSKYSSFTKIT